MRKIAGHVQFESILVTATRKMIYHVDILEADLELVYTISAM
jgi:hypothetical protein